MRGVFLIILFLFAIFVLSLFFLLIFEFAHFLFYELIGKNAPFVPTRTKKYKKEFNELFDFLNNLDLKNKKFIDLGSGNGNIVFQFAKMGYESYGVEIDPFLIFLSRLRAGNYKNAVFIKSDIFKINLQNFGIVYIYQLASINKKLLLKFKDELQKGSIIISHRFTFPDDDKIKLIKIIGENIFNIYQKIT